MSNFIRIENSIKDHVKFELLWLSKHRYTANDKYSIVLQPREVKTMKIGQTKLSKCNYEVFYCITLLPRHIKQTSSSSTLKLQRQNPPVFSVCHHLTIKQGPKWRPNESCEHLIDPYATYELKNEYSSIVNSPKQRKYCQKHFYLPYSRRGVALWVRP